MLAALLLPTSVLWLDKAPSAEIDMTLVGWVTAAVVCLFFALRDTGLSLGWLVAALACVAGGTLTKWTAPAFFYLTAVPLLAWRGQLRHLFGWRHVVALGVSVGVCAGWALAVAQQVGWDALADTVRREAAYRFSPPPKAKGRPWHGVVTYPALVFAAHLPLAGFALLTLRRSFFGRFDERGKLLLQLLHCWTWPNLLFWAVVPNHNVRYALPMSPGLMGLGVMGLIGWVHSRTGTEDEPHDSRRKSHDQDKNHSSGSDRALFCANRAACILLVWIAVKIAFVELVIPKRTAGRGAAATAARLRVLVPADATLYLFKLKDEGVMFSYARPTRKLHHPAALPPGGFAVLIRQEWESRAAFGELEMVQWMHDQQGDPLIVVRKGQ